MKKVLLAGAALVALTVAGAASAADLPSRRAAPAPYVAPIFSWTGFYAGVNAGYAINGEDKLKFDNSQTVLPYGTANNADDGSFTGGGQIGYNYQMGSVVVGIEADINYISLEKDYSLTVGTTDHTQTLNSKGKTEWFGTVRPRLGFVPVDRLLVFVTGGLAYGQVKTTTTYNDFNYATGTTGFGHSSKDDTRVGWTLGAGMEYAVTDNITVKGEYAYVDLGDKNNTTTGVDSAGNQVLFNSKNETNFHVIRAGLNYKF